MTHPAHPHRLDDGPWAPEAFIEDLAAGWQLGDADAFVAHFKPSFHPDVRSSQPLSKPRIGFAALERQFRGIFALLPGVTATVKAWAAAQPNIYVEFEIAASRNGRRLAMTSCDRFTFASGMITERCVYFDPTKLLGFVLPQPALWPSLLRAR